MTTYPQVFANQVLINKVAVGFPELTFREVECLYYIGIGFTYADAAKILSISVNTFKNHASNVMSKMQLIDLSELKIVFHNRLLLLIL